MKPNNILILGSIVTIILILLWQFNIIGEPIAALGGALLTFVGYIFTNDSKPANNTTENNSTVIIKEKKKHINRNISQSHSGSGDNIAGDKIVNKQ